MFVNILLKRLSVWIPLFDKKSEVSETRKISDLFFSTILGFCQKEGGRYNSDFHNTNPLKRDS